MTFLPVDAAVPEVSFTIGKPFGNAVTRNRGRRRLRDAFVASWEQRGPEQQRDLLGAYLLTGNQGLVKAPFTSLVDDVSACLDRLGHRRPDSPDPR